MQPAHLYMHWHEKCNLKLYDKSGGLPTVTLFFCPGEQVGLISSPTCVSPQISSPSILMMNSVTRLVGLPSWASAFMKASMSWSVSNPNISSSSIIASNMSATRSYSENLPWKDCSPSLEESSLLTERLDPTSVMWLAWYTRHIFERSKSCTASNLKHKRAMPPQSRSVLRSMHHLKSIRTKLRSIYPLLILQILIKM